MIIALWIALIICVVWIALGEMPAGWDGHLPLPYLIALIPLLWIPTLVIAVAGFALHEPALGESLRWSVLRRCYAKSHIGWKILILPILRRGLPKNLRKSVKHLVKQAMKLLRNPRNMAVSV